MYEAHIADLPDEAGLAQVWEGYKEHFNAHRVSTELVILELLRKSHPDCHVTCTMPSKCDLLGFAAAGHATATIDRDEPYEAVRLYKEPGPRLVKKPGVLNDHVRFGQWLYAWNDYKFFLYEVVFTEPMRGPTKLYFVLSHHSQGTIYKGLCSATDELLLAVGAWSTEIHKEIYVFDEGRWCKSRELWKSVQGCSWEDVILDSGLKANLIEDVHGFFNNQEIYKKLSVPWKRGVILHGVPGNGKTISIKAFINTLTTRPDPIPSLYVKSFDACQGSKFAIRSIFMHARTMAPCLLIFEDLDSLVTDETRSYFLNEVDGLESNDGILMIGSTNHLDALDPAISKRPSRFDRKYHFQLPREEERIAYCQFWKRKLADGNMVDFQDELCPIIAKMTQGFSFAYLKELFVWALLTVARGGTCEEEEAIANQDGPQTGEASSTTSTDGHVIVNREDVSVEDSGAVDETAFAGTGRTETGIGEASQKPRTLPEVDIPANLRSNFFLNVVRAQIKMLHEEMDSSHNAEKKKVGLPGADMPVRLRHIPNVQFARPGSEM